MIFRRQSYFNSYKVRLKRVTVMVVAVYNHKFQFHYGVITSYVFNNFLLVLFSATLQRFCAALECNSYKVRLKVSRRRWCPALRAYFNSYKVRLKVSIKKSVMCVKRNFNSYKVRLKVLRAKETTPHHYYFNSTLVRLKGHYYSLVVTQRDHFNSTLVRLKVSVKCTYNERIAISIPLWLD